MKKIPFNTNITLELEGTFLEKHLKGLAIMPSITMEYRYDWDGEYGAPCPSEFSFVQISIKNKSDYSDEVHDMILDLVGEFEDNMKAEFLDELTTNWGEFATAHLDAEAEHRERWGY